MCSSVRVDLAYYLLYYTIISGVPMAPGKPIATKSSPTYISISWSIPAADGGSKILGYHVERKHKVGHKWIR